VLVLSKKGSLVEVTKTRVGVRSGRVAGRRRLPLQLVIPAFAAAAILPWILSGSRLLSATVTLVFVLIYASLSLLVGLSRQVSLCHAVFVGLGATTFAHLLENHVPFPLALLLAGLAVVPIGAVVAIPAIRLSGLFLALATFGFGILVQSLVFPSSLGFGRSGVLSLSRPSLFSGDKAYFLLVLFVVTAGVVGIELLFRTRLGRLLRALADSQRAVESVGVNPTASRVLVFCMSAFLAAIAGGLLGALFQSINPVSFDFFQSLVWLTVLVTAGAATLGGSVLAAVLFAAVPAIFTSSKVTEYQPIFFGVMAMLLAQAPNGLIGHLRLPDFRQLAADNTWRLRSSRHRQRTEDSGRRAAGRAVGARSAEPAA
jgi:ABC-type branched-subunit amino acid transport system permease subunit